MKTAILGVALLAGLPAMAQTNAPGGTAHPSPYNFAGVQYPRIETDGRVTFRLNAPKAGQVVVNGDWPGGRGLSMAKGASGEWTLTTDPLAPEIWTYTYSVDGVTTLDPGNARVLRDGTRRANAVLVPGAGSANFPGSGGGRRHGGGQT